VCSFLFLTLNPHISNPRRLFKARLYSKTVTDSITLSPADSLSQRALDLLAAGSPAEAAQAFRAAIAADPAHGEAHHGLIRSLRDAGQIDESVAAARALTGLTPNDPLAHTALSISLKNAGHIPEAEAAAGRARILEWRLQLQFPPGPDLQP
jgi:Flp pilus assembly protein TadD